MNKIILEINLPTTKGHNYENYDREMRNFTVVIIICENLQCMQLYLKSKNYIHRKVTAAEHPGLTSISGKLSERRAVSSPW